MKKLINLNKLLRGGGNLDSIIWAGTAKEIELNLDIISRQLLELRGSFAFCKKIKNNIILGVDSIRSIPLYYQVTDKEVIVSDNAGTIAKYSGSLIQKKSVREFLKTSYVTGAETIYCNISQVVAGEYVKIDLYSGQVERNIYFSLNYKNLFTTNISVEEYQRKWDICLLSVFKDMLIRINGRPILVPLSGGCDSRTVIVLLKRLKYENVYCLAYGRKDSFEVKASKKVADVLGYKWLYVEYDKDMWNTFFQSKDYFDFIKFSSRGAEIGCIQALPAILYLVRNNLIPDSSVVVPGHALDFLAGSHLPQLKPNEIWPKDRLVKYILSGHYGLNNEVKEIKPEWIKHISSVVTREEIINVYQKWDWENRQAKFIANDVRTYEFSGLTYELPFWDIRCCRFWEDVPYQLLYARKLQFLYTKKYIDPIAGVRNDYFGAESRSLKFLVSKCLGNIFPFFKLYTYYRECMYQYNNHVIAIYDFIEKEEYKEYLRRFGLGFNINSIVALDYIHIVLGENKKCWQE